MAAFYASAREGKGQHCEKNNKQAERCGGDAVGAFGQDGDAAVDEFEVNPIDEQGSLTEKDQRAEKMRD